MATQSLPSIIVLCLTVLFLSSCGAFSNQYSYNSSRGGKAPEPTNRPDSRSDREPKAEEEEDFVDFEEEETEDNKADEKITEELPPLKKEEKKKVVELSDEEKLRQDIIDYAQVYVGTKYVYGGKTPDGFDCSGFTAHVMRKYDVELPPVSASQAKEGKKVKVKDARAGDLVFFRKTPTGKVFHVAMVVDNDDKEGLTVIHSTSRGVVVDNITKSSYWWPKVSIVRDVLDE